jgi:hypothetical protein
VYISAGTEVTVLEEVDGVGLRMGQWSQCLTLPLFTS